VPDLHVSNLQTSLLPFEESHQLAVDVLKEEWASLRPGEELPTRLNLTFTDRKIPDLYITNWNEDAHTKAGTFRLAHLLEPDLQRALVVCEAWYLVASTPEDLAYMESGGTASEHPQRRECVKVSTYERDGRQLTTTFEILEGRKLGEPETSDIRGQGGLTFFTERPH
jgi:hypothetical protein